MREDALLRHIIGRASDPAWAGAGVVVGPGDDAAVVRTPSGDLLVMTVDQVVRGRHFVAGTPLDLVARKAIARSVSDLAAMTAMPAWSLATGALPAAYPQDEARELFDRMHFWAREFGCPLVGGDIAASAGDEMVLTVTAVGLLARDTAPPLRSGAKVGDGVYVTGEIGGSFEVATGLGRHLTFVPRVKEARALAAMLGGELHAMMDVSDGVGVDAGRIARASGVRVVIEGERVPLAAGVGSVEAGIGQGEDYELLFTVAEGVEVPARCAATGTKITRIGRVEAGAGVYLYVEGEMRGIEGAGWEHGGQ